MVSKVRGVGFVVLVLSAVVFGQARKPAPTITVVVDATNTPRKIFHATLKIPPPLALSPSTIPNGFLVSTDRPDPSRI